MQASVSEPASPGRNRVFAQAFSQTHSHTLEFVATPSSAQPFQRPKPRLHRILQESLCEALMELDPSTPPRPTGHADLVTSNH